MSLPFLFLAVLAGACLLAAVMVALEWAGRSYR